MSGFRSIDRAQAGDGGSLVRSCYAEKNGFIWWRVVLQCLEAFALTRLREGGGEVTQRRKPSAHGQCYNCAECGGGEIRHPPLLQAYNIYFLSNGQFRSTIPCFHGKEVSQRTAIFRRLLLSLVAEVVSGSESVAHT